MKKLNYIFISFSFLLIASCTSNDTINNLVTESDLAGEWGVYSLYTDQGIANAYANGQSISGSFNAYASNISLTTFFEGTPNVFTAQGSLTANSNISILGQDFNDVIDINNVSNLTASADWSLLDNRISFTNENEIILADIIYFNTDTLRLKTAFDRNLIDYSGTDIIQQIDSISNNIISLDSLRINADLYLTLIR